MELNNSTPEDDYRPSRTRKVVRIIGLAVVGVIFASIFALLFGLLVKWLWNWLMPELFGLGVITYWQAFGLVLLAKLLFGGFGHHYHDRRYYRGREQNGFRGSFWNHGHSSKWRKYDRYWREEGRAAFDTWLEKTGDRAGGQNERNNVDTTEGKGK